MKKRRLIVFALAFVVGTTLIAQEATEETAPQSEAEIVFDQADDAQAAPNQIEPVGSVSVWSFVSMFLVLAGVVAAIYGLFYFLKRMSGQNYADNNLIKVLSTKSLSSTRAVHLVSLGKRYLLIGSAENSVNLLTEIDDKESRDEIEVFLAKDEESPKRSFKELLGGILPGGGSKVDETVSSSAIFLKSQGDRVKNL